MSIAPPQSHDTAACRAATTRAHQELIEVLTAIAHYAEACAEISKQHAHPRGDQVVDWVARINTQVQRGGSVVKRLMEQEQNGP
jgi:hypothetical protein